MVRGVAAAVVVLVVASAAPLRAQPASPVPPPGTITERRTTPEDRYAPAGGCYVVWAPAASRFVARHDDEWRYRADGPDVAAAEPFRFQATDLGRYVLYDHAGDFLASNASVVDHPTDAADWSLEERGDGAFTLRVPSEGRTLTASPVGELRLVADADPDASGDPGRFELRLADDARCADFPDVELNISGPHARGSSPTEEVRGFLDGHLHMMAFEFIGGLVHCGRPWHRFGVAHALVDCPDHYLLDGAGAVLENFLSYKTPVGSHDPVGWPTFRDWPAPRSLTHEQVYYRWLERAWRGGLRMLVNLFVDNGVLCDVYPLKRNSCDEMEGVRLQAQRIRQLERYIDAQSGGPGEGWFRIVTDPFEARRVMNDGRLAVVLGIEVSELFGCSLWLGQPQCTEADIDRQLDEVYALGVRQLELVNKFDNALAGVAGDGGSTGLVVNAGNFLGTGRFWDMRSCDHDHTGVHDHDQITLPGELASQDALFGGILSQFHVSGALPLYPEPHHCNRMGLTPLGAYTIEGMISRQMIFDPDHMSVLARQQALDVVEAFGYPGVVSSHSWATPDAYPRIYALGGTTTPYAGNAEDFVDAWRERRRMAGATGDECFGIGWGADANGLGAQGLPRGAGVENPVRYPFEGFGGTVVDRQVSGRRTYDINVDGVAHYGLYPDWVEDLRQLAGDDIVDDLSCGPEAYLQMWERAVGVPTPSGAPCPDLSVVTPGMTAEQVLLAAGQPSSRRGETYTYCDRVVSFDDDGRVVAAPSLLAARASGGASLPATGELLPAGLAAAALAVGLLLRATRRAGGTSAGKRAGLRQ